MVAWFKVECPKCGSKLPSGTKFCGDCGSALPGTTTRCHSCGDEVSAGATFCGNCSAHLAESSAPTMKGNTWKRKEGDFATRVEVSDVEGLFKKGLNVEEGTKAVIFQNGAYRDIIGAGRYDMGGIVHKIKNIFSSKTLTALLVDRGDVEFRFDFTRLMTSDPIRLAIEANIVASLGDPTKLFENLMKGRENYSLAELQNFLEPEIRNALQESLSRHSVADLSTDASLKKSIEMNVAEHLAVTSQRKGLKIVQLRVFNFRHPRVDEMNNIREEYWLDAEEMKAHIAGQGSTMPLERRLLDQETAKKLMEVEVFEERAGVYQRMREAVASDQMNEVRTEDDLETFLSQFDKKKLVRAEEMFTLKRDFAERVEDHDRARGHLIRKLKLAQDHEIERAQLSHELGLRRTVTDADRGERMAELDQQLDENRKAFDLRQKQEWVEFQQNLAYRKANFDQEHEEDLRDLETAMRAQEVLRRQKQLKQEELDLEAQRAMRLKDQDHHHGVERLKVKSAATTEALISEAGGNAGELLADLKKTETMKGMTEEQILALVAAGSPAVASALSEKFKAQGAASGQVMAEKDKAMAMLLEMAQNNQRMQQEMFNKALDTQRDTATAAARSGQPGVAIVTPGAGPAGVVPNIMPGYGVSSAGPLTTPSEEGRKRICVKCGIEMPADKKFCVECGHKLEG